MGEALIYTHSSITFTAPSPTTHKKIMTRLLTSILYNSSAIFALTKYGREYLLEHVFSNIDR